MSRLGASRPIAKPHPQRCPYVTGNAEAVWDAGAMLTTPIIKTCKKCGERSEHVATLPHGGGYEIYQCLDCKSVEWVPLKLVPNAERRTIE